MNYNPPFHVLIHVSFVRLTADQSINLLGSNQSYFLYWKLSFHHDDVFISTLVFLFFEYTSFVSTKAQKMTYPILSLPFSFLYNGLD